MNKELKNYLHLYLGCEVKVKKKYDINYHIGRMCEISSNSNHGDWIEVMFDGVITATDSSFVPSTSNMHSYFIGEWDEIKPILRKISDITEEEAREYGKLYGINNDNMEVKIGHNTDGTLMIRFSNSEHGATLFPLSNWGQKPETFRFLLSKHFDLFRLIEEGLAIDKMTIPQKEI